ncbi:MAG: hypothetical protein ACRCUP_00050 [Mycoplasmatales bacterium]
MERFFMRKKYFRATSKVFKQEAFLQLLRIFILVLEILVKLLIK